MYQICFFSCYFISYSIAEFYMNDNVSLWTKKIASKLLWCKFCVRTNNCTCKHTYLILFIFVFLVQKISPDSKEKVQLQILMYDGSANTFHFNHSLGREQQIKDRDTIKELLQQLLPQFRKKVSSELEEKNKYVFFFF